MHKQADDLTYICLNCGTSVQGKFCPKCGQKTSAGRITIRHIVHDFLYRFTHVESGILYLIKEQFIRPGVVVREYIEGKRKKYFNPFQYVLIGVAVVTFVNINLDLGTALFGQITVKGENAEVIMLSFTSFIYRYFNIILMFGIPVMAFYSRMFFRKAGYNYAEHLVLNTFVTGQRHLLFLLAAPFLYFFRENPQPVIRIFGMVFVFYLIWTYVQFFQPARLRGKIWCGIKAFLIAFLFFITNGLLIGGIYVLFFR